MVHFVVSSMLMFCLTAVQQTPPPARANHLKTLEFLVGGTWTAGGEFLGFGKYIAERSYRWSLDSSFIEQHHLLTLNSHQIEAIGFLGWDPNKNQVVAYGFGNDGGIATTAATIQGKVIIFEGSRIGGFNPGPLRGTFTIMSNDDYTESVEVQKDGVWVPSFSFHWVRKSE